jgi:hypothetical protein
LALSIQIRAVVSSGLLLSLSAPVNAQRNRTDLGYAEVSIINCRPTVVQECEDFYTKQFHSAAEALTRKRLLSGYLVTRIVFPPPLEAGYTHILETQSEQPLPAEHSDEFVSTRDAALGMQRGEADLRFAQLRELSTRFRTATMSQAGNLPVAGDYVKVEFIKSTPETRAPLSDWMRSTRQAMMERLVQEGRISGWSFRPLQLRGFDEPFDAIETTYYKDPSVVMGGGDPIDFRAIFHKVFPGTGIDKYEKDSNQLRYVTRTRVGRIIDVVGPLNGQ